MFASVFVAVLIFTILSDNESPILPNALLYSFLVAYMVSAAFSGFVFSCAQREAASAVGVGNIRTFLPATLIITCFIGTAITPAYVINSLKGIFGNRENGYEKSK
jgi:Flp pilus assembly protein protease CpaA